MHSLHMLFLFGFFCFGFACNAVQVVRPELSVVNVTLGDTPMAIATFSYGSPPFDFAFLNLHQNENTSVVAAKALISASDSLSGSITYLVHGGDRILNFSIG
jgi:hypothetical protein